MAKRSAEDKKEAAVSTRSSARIKAANQIAPVEPPKESAPKKKSPVEPKEKKEPAAKKQKVEKKEASEKEEAVKSPSSSKLAVGSKLTKGQFVLTNEEEESVDLFEASQDQGIIIFFYPKANTPGCTKQACGFRDNYEDVVKAGYHVYGCSADSAKSQKNWKEKNSFPYHLLTDKDHKFIKAVGASTAEKKIKRSHVVIGKGGVVEDMQIQISPADSVSRAVEFTQAKL